MSTCNLDTYQCSDVGLLMPFVSEYTWSTNARTVIYLLGLLWSFMGVSIIADIFMQSIEVITSRTNVIEVYDPDSETGKKDIHVKTWNNTVANLTLMALGSSAPEILLSIIEIVFNDFKAGELGPGTIVGSAAFNLFVITGVCIFTIPDGEVRRIKAIKVFAITAVFCVFAYLWLIIILVVITPDFVDLWEAMITLLYFPLLVLLAYMADKEFCCSKTQEVDQEKEVSLEPMNDEDQTGKVELVSNHADQKVIMDALKKIGNRPDLTEEDEARIITAIVAKHQSHDRAWYRINAIRNITGGHKLVPNCNAKQNEILKTIERGESVSDSMISLSYTPGAGNKSVFEWAAASSAVLEQDKQIVLKILRHGNTNIRAFVKVETIDGTAEAEKDYKPLKKTLVFEKGQVEQDIIIDIIDDNEWEPDEVFNVRLSVDPDEPFVLGNKPLCTVTIINDDAPGTFEFSKRGFVFKESAGKALIEVSRCDGADGRASVMWQTKDQDGPHAAVSGRDYEGGSGELIFEHGELKKTIEIPIIDDQDFEKDEHFDIELTDCSTGAKLGRNKKTVVTILNDDEFKGLVSRITSLTNANLDQISVGKGTWAKQIREAMNVNGGDIDAATNFDYFMHFMTFGWKIMFALVPPAHIWGGWLAFGSSLAMIGLLTAIVGDLASIFGCLIGLKPTVTAITFVALGTSLPDLFASMAAAKQEEHADNSIGNVTGSNSVNVFLGLGLPWTIAAIKWGIEGATFEVPAGNLAFSVTLYTICAITTLLLLVIRRYAGVFGGELGGPKAPKAACALFLVFLWIFYVLLSAMQAYGYIESSI